MSRAIVGYLAVLALACTIPVLAETIPLKSEGGTFLVPVVINDQITLKFTLDSGATDVSIPADVFSTLVRTGTIQKSDYLDTRVYELADGTTSRSQRFRIRSLRVGGVELRDVAASVSPAAGSLLLGESFLTRLGTWTIDNRRHLLVINESSSTQPAVVVNESSSTQPADAQPPPTATADRRPSGDPSADYYECVMAQNYCNQPRSSECLAYRQKVSNARHECPGVYDANHPAPIHSAPIQSTPIQPDYLCIAAHNVCNQPQSPECANYRQSFSSSGHVCQGVYER